MLTCCIVTALLILTCDDGEQPPADATPDPLGPVLLVLVPEEAEGDGVPHADQ